MPLKHFAISFLTCCIHKTGVHALSQLGQPMLERPSHHMATSAAKNNLPGRCVVDDRGNPMIPRPSNNNSLSSDATPIWKRQRIFDAGFLPQSPLFVCNLASLMARHWQPHCTARESHPKSATACLAYRQKVRACSRLSGRETDAVLFNGKADI